MGTPSAELVRVGKPNAAGGVSAGPLTATLPTNASSPIDNSLVGLGYISDDGLTQSIGIDTSSVNAWGGDEVRVLRTSHSLTYAFGLLEAANADVLAEVFGEQQVDVVGDTITVRVTKETSGRRRYVFDMLDDDYAIRVVVPNGEITAQEDVSFADGDAISFGVTVSCYPDDDGVKAYIYIAKLGS